MGSVIVSMLVLIASVVPPALAFRYVFTGRPGRGWVMPLAVAGVGAGAIVWLELVAVSEQSRLFGSLALVLIFGLAAVLSVVSCLLGHAARLVAAGLSGTLDD